MYEQVVDTEAIEDLAHAADMVAIRVGHDCDVHLWGAVAFEHGDDGVAVRLPASVDDNVGHPAGVWSSKARRDGIGILLVANLEYIDLIHVWLASGDVSPIGTSCSWIAT